MQARTKYAIALVALTLLVLVLRLSVAFSVEAPSYTSYFTLLQANEILETGMPLFEDARSFQGRTFAFNPLYYYLVALLILVLPATFVLKLLPNLAMAALIPLVYLIAHRLTKNRSVSFLVAFFAAFAPILFTSFLNEATPLSLALPLSAGLLFALLDVEARPIPALVLMVLLTLLHPIIWLFLGMFIAYLLILAAERIKIHAPLMEMALITFLLAAWYTLVTYKQALFREGFAIFWGSLPSMVRAEMFQEFSFLAMIYAVGVIPLALGAYALYHNSFEMRVRKHFLLAALALTTLVAAIFQVIPLRVALLYLSLAFLLLSAPALHNMIVYMRKTRFPKLAPVVLSFIILFFILTSLLPAIATGIWPQLSPTQEEIDAAIWLGAETPEDAVILAAPKTGFLLNVAARRAYVADTDYLLITNPDRILADMDAIYTTPFTVAATELLTKNGVTHILLGSAENERYGELGAIAKDRECFPLVYKNPTVAIFKVECTIARSDA